MASHRLTQDEKLIRELRSDLAHLRRQSELLIDKMYLTQDRIQATRWRLRKMRSYSLPDGPTNRGHLRG